MPGTEPEKEPDQIPEKKRKKEIERRKAKVSQQPLKK